jgi:hypothetical protein
MAIILTLAAIIWSDANPGQYRSGLNAFVVGVRNSAFLVLSLALSLFFYLTLSNSTLHSWSIIDAHTIDRRVNRSSCG